MPGWGVCGGDRSIKLHELRGRDGIDHCWRRCVVRLRHLCSRDVQCDCWIVGLCKLRYRQLLKLRSIELHKLRGRHLPVSDRLIKLHKLRSRDLLVNHFGSSVNDVCRLFWWGLLSRRIIKLCVMRCRILFNHGIRLVRKLSRGHVSVLDGVIELHELSVVDVLHSDRGDSVEHLHELPSRLSDFSRRDKLLIVPGGEIFGVIIMCGLPSRNVPSHWERIKLRGVRCGNVCGRHRGYELQ